MVNRKTNQMYFFPNNESNTLLNTCRIQKVVSSFMRCRQCFLQGICLLFDPVLNVSFIRMVSVEEKFFLKPFLILLPPVS